MKKCVLGITEMYRLIHCVCVCVYYIKETECIRTAGQRFSYLINCHCCEIKSHRAITHGYWVPDREMEKKMPRKYRHSTGGELGFSYPERIFRCAYFSQYTNVFIFGKYLQQM